jgi:hypothetical protein
VLLRLVLLLRTGSIVSVEVSLAATTTLLVMSAGPALTLTVTALTMSGAVVLFGPLAATPRVAEFSLIPLRGPGGLDRAVMTSYRRGCGGRGIALVRLVLRLRERK